VSSHGGGEPDGGGFTVLLVARVPARAREAFDGYEAQAVVLLAEPGGRVERRLVTVDGGVEAHVVWFPHRAAFDAYRGDQRRAAITPNPRTLGVEVEVHEVRDLPGPP
jgi:hypothetical protein